MFLDPKPLEIACSSVLSHLCTIMKTYFIHFLYQSKLKNIRVYLESLKLYSCLDLPQDCICSIRFFSEDVIVQNSMDIICGHSKNWLYFWKLFIQVVFNGEVSCIPSFLGMCHSSNQKTPKPQVSGWPKHWQNNDKNFNIIDEMQSFSYVLLLSFAPAL